MSKQKSRQIKEKEAIRRARYSRLYRTVKKQNEQRLDRISELTIQLDMSLEDLGPPLRPARDPPADNLLYRYTSLVGILPGRAINDDGVFYTVHDESYLKQMIKHLKVLLNEHKEAAKRDPEYDGLMTELDILREDCKRMWNYGGYLNEAHQYVRFLAAGDFNLYMVDYEKYLDAMLHRDARQTELRALQRTTVRKMIRELERDMFPADDLLLQLADGEDSTDLDTDVETDDEPSAQAPEAGLAYIPNDGQVEKEEEAGSPKRSEKPSTDKNDKDDEDQDDEDQDDEDQDEGDGTMSPERSEKPSTNTDKEADADDKEGEGEKSVSPDPSETPSTNNDTDDEHVDEEGEDDEEDEDVDEEEDSPTPSRSETPSAHVDSDEYEASPPRNQVPIMKPGGTPRPSRTRMPWDRSSQSALNTPTRPRRSVHSSPVRRLLSPTRPSKSVSLREIEIKTKDPLQRDCLAEETGSASRPASPHQRPSAGPINVQTIDSTRSIGPQLAVPEDDLEDMFSFAEEALKGSEAIEGSQMPPDMTTTDEHAQIVDKGVEPSSRPQAPDNPIADEPEAKEVAQVARRSTRGKRAAPDPSTEGSRQPLEAGGVDERPLKRKKYVGARSPRATKQIAPATKANAETAAPSADNGERSLEGVERVEVEVAVAEEPKKKRGRPKKIVQPDASLPGASAPDGSRGLEGKAASPEKGNYMVKEAGKGRGRGGRRGGRGGRGGRGKKAVGG